LRLLHLLSTSWLFIAWVFEHMCGWPLLGLLGGWPFVRSLLRSLMMMVVLVEGAL
jgi:hypothetical protein